MFWLFGLSVEEIKKRLENEEYVLGGFYSFDILAKEFVKRNNLDEPRYIHLQKGMMLRFEDEEKSVIRMTSSVDLECENTFYKVKREYSLDGIIKNENVSLKALICHKQNMGVLNEDCPFGARIILNEEPEITITRFDNNHRYWFVTD